MMKRSVIVSLCALFTLTQQVRKYKKYNDDDILFLKLIYKWSHSADFKCSYTWYSVFMLLHVSYSWFQAPSVDNCACELTHSETVFPHDKLTKVKDSASQCNSNINRQKVSTRVPSLSRCIISSSRSSINILLSVCRLWSWTSCCRVWRSVCPSCRKIYHSWRWRMMKTSMKFSACMW